MDGIIHVFTHRKHDFCTCKAVGTAVVMAKVQGEMLAKRRKRIRRQDDIFRTEFHGAVKGHGRQNKIILIGDLVQDGGIKIHVVHNYRIVIEIGEVFLPNIPKGGLVRYVLRTYSVDRYIAGTKSAFRVNKNMAVENDGIIFDKCNAHSANRIIVRIWRFKVDGNKIH